MNDPASNTGRVPAVETAEPNTRRIWLYLWIAIVFLVVFHFSAYYWFLGMKDAELQAKELYRSDRSLSSPGTQETAALDRYRWVDKENGRVQIPVSRAMELIAEEQKAKRQIKRN